MGDEKSRMEKSVNIIIYHSDGGDGYAKGTWGWRIEFSVGGVEFDGGYSKRTDAEEDGLETIKKLQEWIDKKPTGLFQD
jgi:hypothetical protein